MALGTGKLADIEAALASGRGKLERAAEAARKEQDMTPPPRGGAAPKAAPEEPKAALDTRPGAWAEKMRSEAEERRAFLLGEIAKLEPLRAELAETEAVLAALGVPPAPLEAVPPPEPEPEPVSPPEPEPVDAAALELVELIREAGPMSTAEARDSLGVESIRVAVDAAVDAGMLELTDEKAADGFRIMRLPGTAAPEAPPAPPARPERRAPDGKHDREAMKRWIEEHGIVTVGRFKEAFGVGPAFATGFFRELAEAGVVLRRGGERGPGVFYVHRDYKGEESPAAAKGGARGAVAPPPRAPEPHAPEAKDLEGVPEDLRGMPGARTGGRLEQRIEVATQQKAVADMLGRMGDATANELGERLGIPPARVAGYLRDLQPTGRIALAGDTRAKAPVYKPGDGTPVPDELPPHLAEMPVAKVDVPFAMKWTIAMQQQRVVEEARAFGKPFVIAEFEGRLPWPRARTGDYLNALADAGVGIRRTGKMRRAHGQLAGRTANEYVAKEAPSSGAAAPVAAPEAPGAEPDHDAVPTAEQVRDAVVGREGMFSVANLLGDAGEDAGWDYGVTLARLRRLAEREIVKDVSPTPDMPLFSYVAPEGPGAAAEAQRRLGIAGLGGGGDGLPAAPRRTGQGPSGRRLTLTNPDVRKLVRDAEAKGCDAAMAGNGHVQITTPEGRRVLIANTPRSPRTVENDRKRVRRAGVDV